MNSAAHRVRIAFPPGVGTSRRPTSAHVRPRQRLSAATAVGGHSVPSVVLRSLPRFRSSTFPLQRFLLLRPRPGPALRRRLLPPDCHISSKQQVLGTFLNSFFRLLFRGSLPLVGFVRDMCYSIDCKTYYLDYSSDVGISCPCTPNVMADVEE